MRGRRKMLLTFVLVLAGLWPGGVEAAWGYSGDSVLLKDVEVLTLYSGKMTTGGRSSPVAQLECIKGGTAPCTAFSPRVVQCYNRGWDGVDVQWECKTDMDNAFRFGEVEVSCEGYSNRDDPYVLRGSCGLRYSLDYTKEGLNQQQGHNYYGSQDSGYSYSGNTHQTYGSAKLSSSSTFADLIVFVAVALMCYAFYITCCGSNRQVGQDAYSTTDGDHPAGGGGGGYGWFGQGGGAHNPTAPPPPEYRDDASCRNRTGNAGGANVGAGAGGGGFWTGAAAGGLLGYMCGNRGNQHYGQYGGYHQPRRGGGWFSGGGGGGFGGGGGGFTGGSTGTRGASGFGGTSRR